MVVVGVVVGVCRSSAAVQHLFITTKTQLCKHAEEGGGQERQKWPRERRTGTEDRRRGRRWWWEGGRKQLGFIFMESGVNQPNSRSG